MHPWPYCLAAVLAAAPLAAASAQDRTDAELRAVFERQIDTFRAARDGTDLGAHRGLVLAPVDGPPVEAVRVEQAAPAAAPALDLAPAGDAAAPVAVAEPVSHWVLPEEQQVNLRVNFAFDSAAIAEPEKPKLRQLCTVMDETGIALFRIVGHTDATGDPAYNQRLSVRRAEEVKRFFVDDCGIAADRLEAIGVGKQFPFVEDDPFDGQNRRVEFQAMS